MGPTDEVRAAITAYNEHVMRLSKGLSKRAGLTPEVAAGQELDEGAMGRNDTRDFTSLLIVYQRSSLPAQLRQLHTPVGVPLMPRPPT